MNARIRQVTVMAGAVAILLGSVSCGDVARQGRSPSVVVIDALVAASGASAGQFNGFLNSDVEVIKTVSIGGVDTQVPTIFNDIGKVTLRLILRDLGSPAGEATPTPLNQVTMNRYRVVFHRADGRNTQGVDVPYTFDGAATGTVTPSGIDLIFELVRHSAKEEAPLLALRFQGGRIEIATIADITFYGKDLAGNEVAVTGSISVDFADFADPSS